MKQNTYITSLLLISNFIYAQCPTSVILGYGGSVDRIELIYPSGSNPYCPVPEGGIPNINYTVAGTTYTYSFQSCSSNGVIFRQSPTSQPTPPNGDASLGGIIGSGGSCSVPVISLLPVELTVFTGKNIRNDIYLNWTTKSEINNDFFTIQRSFDGEHFTNVGQLRGAGTTNIEQNYRFIDEQIYKIATSDVAYYRLIQADLDETPYYSDVIKVDILEGNGKHPELINVIKGIDNQWQVIYYAPNQYPTEISVFDVSGKNIMTQINTTVQGVNTTQLEVGELQDGLFVVTILNNGEFSTFKVMNIQ